MYSGDGSARMQGDKLVLVPKTADCFRATVSVLRSIDATKGQQGERFDVSLWNQSDSRNVSASQGTYTV